MTKISITKDVLWQGDKWLHMMEQTVLRTVQTSQQQHHGRRNQFQVWHRINVLYWLSRGKTSSACVRDGLQCRITQCPNKQPLHMFSGVWRDWTTWLQVTVATYLSSELYLLKRCVKTTDARRVECKWCLCRPQAWYRPRQQPSPDPAGSSRSTGSPARPAFNKTNDERRASNWAHSAQTSLGPRWIKRWRPLAGSSLVGGAALCDSSP